MRRKERECRDADFFQQVFTRSEVITLAFHDGEYPYSVALSFVEMTGALYMHCAQEGHKIDCLKRDPHVHFTAHDYIGVNKKAATVLYRSIAGTGMAELVQDKEEKQLALTALARKYDSACTLPVPDKMLDATGIIKINITSLTGKKNEPAA